jgi:hypothetical protein
MIRPHPPPQLPPQRPPFHRRPTDVLSYNSQPTFAELQGLQDLNDRHYTQKVQDARNRQDLPDTQNIYNGHALSEGGSQHQSSLPFSQMPLRYAHPLPRTNSYPPPDSQKEEHRRAAARSEHMLRRKTPNGILNAAYDGTSVEQTDRPHAMKHILLPVTEHFSASPTGTNQSLARDLPLRPTLQQLDSSFGLSQQHTNGQNGQWQNNLHFVPEQAKPSWNLPQLPQIDSMLNQMPTQSQHLQYLQNGHSPYAFMPPIFQPSFGPTASNDTGPYGPYWPNGTFVPYRPAALRDMRYYPHHSSSWLNQPIQHENSTNNNFQNSTLYPISQHRQDIGSMGNISFATPHHFLPSARDEMNAQHSISRFLSSQPVYGGSHTPQSDRSFLGEGPQSFMSSTSALRIPPVHPLDTPSRLDSGIKSGQTTPTPRTYQPSSSSLSEFGAGSSNAQLREKVFSWAHSVYVDLLKYLHSIRRRGHQNRHGTNHHSSGPNIYPRPPRQPSCDFSSSSNSTSSRSSVEHRQFSQSISQPHSRISSHRDAGLEQDSLSRGPTPSPWPSQERPYHLPRDCPPSWQSQAYASSALAQPLNGHQQSRTLRRTLGTLHASHSTGPRPETNHVANATSALDSLGEICQGADWKWVDGLLLGGCLAYALGDYQKAAEWYTKILSIDARYAPSFPSLRQLAFVTFCSFPLCSCLSVQYCATAVLT